MNLWNWLKRLFRLRVEKGPRKVVWPTRQEIELLPWFDGLGFSHIVLVENDQSARQAYEALSREAVVGFDTESKPTFVKGEVSDGPHVAQFSTAERAWVFPLYHAEGRKVTGALLQLAELKKVGFGLGDDVKRIKIKMNIHPHNVLDLETLFTEHGYGRGVGAKVGTAMMFKRRLRKSKRAATSNWKNRRLTEQQVLYAANDAYAAIKAYLALIERH